MAGWRKRHQQRPAAPGMAGWHTGHKRRLTTLRKIAPDAYAYLDHPPSQLSERNSELVELAFQGLSDPYPRDGFLQAARAVTAQGLAIVEAQFGVDQDHPKTFSGTVHRNVPYTYHNGEHSGDGVLLGTYRYMTAINQQQPGTYGARDLMLGVVAAALHDSVQGHGRRVDEQSAATMAVALMDRHTVFNKRDKAKVYHAIMATTFVGGKQNVLSHLPGRLLQKAVAVGDMSGLARADGVSRSIALAVEEFSHTNNRFGVDLGKSLRDAHVDTTNWRTRDYLRFIGTQKDLNDAFGRYVEDQVKFSANFRFADPRADGIFGHRSKNVTFFRQLHEQLNGLQGPQITPEEAYTRAREFEKASAVPRDASGPAATAVLERGPSSPSAAARSGSTPPTTQHDQHPKHGGPWQFRDAGGTGFRDLRRGAGAPPSRDGSTPSPPTQAPVRDPRGQARG